MLGQIGRNIAKIGKCRGGNTIMLVALGLPMLVGGAGMGVDIAQWYMWKRELQYAVDQAAVAAAWARTNADTENTFQARATQEFNANIAALEGATSTPSVALANFAAGSNNSVTVSATATRALPFSKFIMGGQVTVRATAQAMFEEGATFTSCLIAVDEHETGAITINGTTVLTASCGLAALSDAAEAISVNGEPEVDAGWIIARGGIDPWLIENTDDIIMEHMEGLYDPFEDLTPPEPAESRVAKTYSCVATAGYTTADYTETVVTSYSYFMGSNKNGANPYTYDQGKPSTSTEGSGNDVTVPEGTTAGAKSPTSNTAWTNFQAGSGNSKIFEKKTVTTTRTYSDIKPHPGTPAGTVSPGTYSSIHVSCDTTFSPGVYIIDGGGVKITGQHEVTGSGVLFVLKNGAWIDIAGGADINLTAIQAGDLIAAGVSSTEASKLAGMLVFEARDSDGSTKTKINGNANTVLNGTIYLPVSPVDFAGTATVTSQCLMVAAAQIKLTGNANMETFCPSDAAEDTTVVSTEGKVKLVA